MGTMLVETDNLSTNGVEEFNITLFTGTIGDYVADAIHAEIESDVDYYTEMTGEDVPESFHDDLNWDYLGAYKALAEDMGDILSGVYPELFTMKSDGSAPVRIVRFTGCNPTDIAGWGREDLGYELEINGPALKALADEYAVTMIDDGKDTSGFFRTAADDYWTQIKTLEALMVELDKDMDNFHWEMLEYTRTGEFAGNYITYSEEFTAAL